MHTQKTVAIIAIGPQGWVYKTNYLPHSDSPIYGPFRSLAAAIDNARRAGFTHYRTGLKDIRFFRS